jgi:hypothetical protein
MSSQIQLLALGVFVATAITPVAMAADGEDLKDYLVDIGPGAVGAHEILGLSSSVVSTLQSPKDFTAAVNTATGDAGKSGFGIAFTPARSGFKPLAVSIGDYATDGKNLTRLWGGTSFSYAQGAKTIDGLDYQRQALAVQINYFIDKSDDPSIAARSAFVNCKARWEDEDKFSEELMQRWDTKLKALGASQPPTEKQAAAFMEELKATTKADFAAAGAKCAAEGFKKAQAKWNKSQIGLTLGKGWIKGPAGGLGRTSLGQHAAVTVAWAPQELTNSLFNLTARRVSREIDTSTLATTPVFKSSSLAAVRYTYGYGEDQDTYLIAEVSNAKASKLTESNSAFKSAFGIDRRIAKGIWIELRAGRSRAESSVREETKVLFNLKLSPEATVPSLTGG